jgi:hypothetical protein
VASQRPSISWVKCFRLVGKQVTRRRRSAGTDKMALHLDLPNLHWPFHEGERINAALGGMSGGGVYRVIEGTPLDRIELVGFIYEYSETSCSRDTRGSSRRTAQSIFMIESARSGIE